MTRSKLRFQKTFNHVQALRVVFTSLPASSIGFLGMGQTNKDDHGAMKSEGCLK